MSSQQSITCPNCATEIDVNQVLSQQLENQLRQEFSSKAAAAKQQQDKRAAELAALQMSLKQQQTELTDKVSEGIASGVASQKRELAEQIRRELNNKLQAENADQIKAMQQELAEKSTQLRELNKARSDIERLKREKDELREATEAEMQKKLSATLNEEREKMRRNADEHAAMKLAERETVINQLKHQLQEAQRKAEQGSMQIQGEVQELAIEEWLRNSFPLDTIDEIRKGARGADCVQIVNTLTAQNCGSIYYESKRTKDFQPAWIEKFKTDLRDNGANIGVIVTEAMPKDMQRMGLRDGIWVCSFSEFKGLCVALRESVVQLNMAVATQHNRGDKMTMLYDYLTSNEFKLQIEAITEGFTQMQTDLAAEKRALASAWKKREKQLDKVLLNTTYMYSSIRGIAGNAVPAVAALEMESFQLNADNEKPE